MIKKQQTAIEWLVEQVNSDCLNSTFIHPDLIARAKKMEKEQIIDAYSADRFPCSEEDAEQYYKEIYNKNNPK
jgi:hypothetical protein